MSTHCFPGVSLWLSGQLCEVDKVGSYTDTIFESWRIDLLLSLVSSFPFGVRKNQTFLLCQKCIPIRFLMFSFDPEYIPDWLTVKTLTSSITNSAVIPALLLCFTKYWVDTRRVFISYVKHIKNNKNMSPQLSILIFPLLPPTQYAALLHKCS